MLAVVRETVLFTDLLQCQRAAGFRCIVLEGERPHVLDEQEKFRGKVAHLPAEVVGCAGLELQPYDVHCPMHEFAQNFVPVPAHGGVDRFGQTKDRAVLCVRYDLAYAFTRTDAVEPEGAGAAEELRRVADTEHRLEAEAERTDLAGSPLGGQTREHEGRHAVPVDRLSVVGAIETISGQPNLDAPDLATRKRGIRTLAVAADR